MKFPFRKLSPRPAVMPRAVGADPRVRPQVSRALRDIVPQRAQNPPGPAPVTTNLFSTTLDGQDYFWLGTNRAAFYRYLRDHVPIISAAIWSWVHLCCTPQSCSLIGDEAEKKAARAILDNLDLRVFENPFVRRPGINHLTELFFLELFTTGRFAGEIVPLADGSGIDYFHTIDPDILIWERKGRWTAYFENESGERIELDPARFFYATLGSDISDPRGIEPLASIPFVAQIQEALLFDMARSSRNAGTPRLQIRITPPPPFAHESEKEYQERINQYFDDTVSQFSRLDADDNLFTWSDVEVRVIGGDQGRTFVWRLNREQVIEDVVTGLRLFPWVLGRSHGTTKNWVEAQFNILMQIVDAVQDMGTSLADWLRNTELRMRGNLATAHHIFSPNEDPFLLPKMQARAIAFETIDKKVQRGYISKDDGARLLGLLKAFKAD
jgi:hypothetical protein